jgi:hypothetical protein
MVFDKISFCFSWTVQKKLPADYFEIFSVKKNKLLFPR